MLMPRLVTAVIFLAITLLILFYASTEMVLLFLMLLTVWAVWEWTGFMSLSDMKSRLVTVVLLGGVASAAFFLSPYPLFSAISICWWCLVAVVLVRFARFGSDQQPILSVNNRWRMMLIGFVLIYPTMASILALREMEHGRSWLLFALSLVWIADTGAYFVGKRWGKTKLAPTISPGKTVEGVLGALAFVAVYVFLLTTFFADLLFGTAQISWAENGWVLFLVSLFVVPVSVLGDLTESAYKRRAGLKDSGGLLPGHGGILDRIDGLTAALPFFLVFLKELVL